MKNVKKLINFKFAYRDKDGKWRTDIIIEAENIPKAIEKFKEHYQGLKYYVIL